MQISITFLENIILNIFGKRESYAMVLFKDDCIIVSKIKRINSEYYKVTINNEQYTFINNSNFSVEYLDGE